ncbi:hypothetical protein B0H66DRAFT_96719 [Apodospora peruviana]|uniref:Glucose-methanol-choline oxidoreductase N-terminal domain-containing protein n=1 Tax=Apodospora peruviana TaxID=516989 RepID=A0AAE0MHP3_9PEZI|nr:hypothetical protein B0H66DRAFT_96719 [Apodospora peruviana]
MAIFRPSAFVIGLLVAIFALRLVSAISASALGARHVINLGDLRESYDFIIVGGGTAGLTIADRLTESSKYNVLVVEYGEFANASDSATLSSRMSAIVSKPQPELGNKTITINVGYCVGGSSAINGMAVMRGTKKDYAIWAELGNKGSTWDWDGMLPYFKKAIHFKPPDPTLAADFNITYDLANWGQYESTRVYASYPGGLNASLKTNYEALQTVPGIDFPKDGHSGRGGLFYYQVSVDPKTRQRSYARTGHWDNLNRTNYDIITGSRVTKILFSNNKVATAVQFVPAKSNGTAAHFIVKARKEIILSAGAIHTPQILQLSGIGPASLLKKAKIPVVVDLPGVGSNFQDHPIGPTALFSYGIQPPISPKNSTLPPSEGQGQGLVADLPLPIAAPDTYIQIARHLASQNPSQFLPPHTPGPVVAGYKAQQAIFAREMLSKELTFLHYIVPPVPAGTPINFHILSRGTVQVDPSSPDSPNPLIDYRALTNPIDVDLMIAYIQFLRIFYLSGPLARYNTTEISPGSNVTSYEQLARFVRTSYSPQGWHPIGTAAKMRRELGGVVDDELRVYGTKRLRVADASVMPTLIGGTTQLTAYAIGEKVADMIKGSW